jgi:preprotein translocase SecE subunit
VAKNMTDRKKNVSRSQQVAEVKAQDRVQTTEKTIKAATREAAKASSSKASAKRDAKGLSFIVRLRNTKLGRFIYDSYYELRYKATWPTIEEARNMTIMVVIISAVLGAILSLVDFGLYHLFVLIIEGK